MPAAGKPDKPYEGYPLYAHGSGQWAKKIRGVTVYFGPWSDPDAALQAFLDQRDDLMAGRVPRVRQEGGPSLERLTAAFLDAKRSQAESGELSRRMWSDYHAAAERLVASMGRRVSVADLRPEDFARARADAAKHFGPVTLAVWIQRVRTIFKWGYESELLEKPVRFGPDFRKPSRRVARLHKATKAIKLIEADVIRKLIDAAAPPLNAMVLLGINCGFGQADIGELPKAAVDLDAGWIVFPRPKTGISRQCPLWPETVEALRIAMANRPHPRGPADDRLFFLTQYGLPWVKYIDRGPERRGVRTDAVSLLFNRLVKRLGLKVKGFYGLRHTFRTIADEVPDKTAIDLTMGHGDESMGANYRQRVDPTRLRKVTDHVRAWLFAGS